MNGISDQSIMAALGRQMTVTVAKQTTAAGNLANLDTPGFRAQEVSFDDVLSGELDSPARMKITQAGHMTAAGAAAGSGDVHDAEGLAARRDGNNVELDRELLQMSRASADFTAAQTALAAKFRLVRYAINEGR
jgi:flagellar basal-body rod protein FlgB